ncbi:hypothetical protein GW17_00002132, partial [Ensete ventricosum]
PHPLPLASPAAVRIAHHETVPRFGLPIEIGGPPESIGLRELRSKRPAVVGVAAEAVAIDRGTDEWWMVALMKIVRPCWKPAPEEGRGRGGGSPARANGLLWYKDLGRHAVGEFSMAVAQANNLLEDGSQIESGPLSWSDEAPGPHGTFVGVYDGHGGPEASRYINERLFLNLKSTSFSFFSILDNTSHFPFASEQQDMSVDVIKKAFSATEEGFISIVRKQWFTKPQIASVGSCCLVGVVSGGILYVANLGDSRAVLGRFDGGFREVTAVQMCPEHNASFESVREELRSLHPNDPQIVVMKHKVWRVKGLIQVI